MGKSLEVVVGSPYVDVGPDVVLLDVDSRLEVLEGIGEPSVRLQSVADIVEEFRVPLIHLAIILVLFTACGPGADPGVEGCAPPLI